MSRELSREFFIELSKDLQNGNWKTMLSCMSRPLIIYLNGVPVVLDSDAQIINIFEEYQCVMVGRGVGRVDVEIVEVVQKPDRAACYLIRKSYFSESGENIGHAKLRYYIRAENDAPKVEMIEYLENTLLEGIVGKFLAYA